MLKRKLKIKQIVMSNSETFWYICGLGNDGQVYIWDKGACNWILNVVSPPEPVPADPLPKTTPRRRGK